MINGPAGYDPIQGGMRTEMKAGPGIDISHGTISTTGEAGVPYVGGTGIYIHGATVEADLDPGYRMEINGSTIGQMRYMPVETVTGSSVTMQAGHAYKIYATSAAITLNTETIPANTFGLEGHLEIFVSGTGYVVTGSNVVLANALEPDAVNNCTVRFHDGYAIISVEDHVAGYIVTVNAASGAGSLAYGLSTATNEYISIDASLNGQTLDLAGATTYAGEKHVVGNGYTETIISGGINCTSKTTFSNLSMDGVVVSSGTLTLGDAYIPSGSTVAVSGGGLAVEKVTGENSLIELNNTNASIASGAVSSCVITGGSSSRYGGAFDVAGAGSAELRNCIVSGNVASAGDWNNNGGGGVCIRTSASCRITGCTFSDNHTGPYNDYQAGGAVLVSTDASLTIEDSVFNETQCIAFLEYGTKAKVTINGSFKTLATITSGFNGSGGKVFLASGAVVDLTGNSNATPIAPGGGITFEEGGATVLYGSSGGAVSSCTISGATVPTIGNAGNVIVTSSARDFYGSGVFNGVRLDGDVGAFLFHNGAFRFNDCSLNTAVVCADKYGNESTIIVNGVCTLSGASYIISYDSANKHGIVAIYRNSILDVANLTVTQVVVSVRLLTVGSNVKLKDGDTVVDVTGGTYHNATLYKDGTITEA